MSAAIVLEENKIPNEILSVIDDSKKLNKKVRKDLFEAMLPLMKFGIGIVGVKEIDNKNILQATMLSMRLAVLQLRQKIDMVLIDGNSNPNLFGLNTKCIVKGDAKSVTIAMASIIAKVTRDNIMSDLAKIYPNYGWTQNAGYGTQKHREALESVGITPEHRKSFAPIRNILVNNCNNHLHFD